MAMDFSRDGDRLVVAGGLPDYNLTVYDVELGVQLHGINEKLPDKNIQKLIFKPDNNNCFAMLTSNGFYVYDIEQIGDYENGELIISYKLKCRNLEQNFAASDIIWDKQGRLMALDKIKSAILIYDTRQEGLIEVAKKEMPAEPLAILLTQTQLIVSLADSTLKWYEYPFDTNEANKKGPEQEITNDKGPFCYMVYNNQMTRIIATTADNAIFTIPSEAQCEEDDEEQVDAMPGGREGEGVQRTKPKAMPIKVGDFLTNRIVGIRELIDSTQVLTLSEDKNVCIWETTNMHQLTKFEIKSKPTCLEIDIKGGIAFIGCVDGTIQVIDLSDKTTLRLIKIIKLFVNPITSIRRSPDGSSLVVCSSSEKGLYFISTIPNDNFVVKAYLPLVGKVNSVDWFQPDPSVPLKLVVVLHNSLLVALTPPNDAVKNQKLDPEKTQATYTVIDNNIKYVLCAPSGDILLTGADRKIKKYDLPDMMYTDLNMQKPALAPASEFPGHGLEIQCWDTSFDAKLLVSGSKDGTYQVKMLSQLGQSKEWKTHSVHQNGITAISFSPSRNMIYIGGGDGSFTIINMSKDPLPTAPKNLAPEVFDEVLRNLDELKEDEPIPDKIMLDKWHEDELARQHEENEKAKANIKQELHHIKEALNSLLLKNAEVPDIEKLDREEFLIDQPRKVRMLAERDQESIKLRKLAAKENLKNEILRQRMKERTWDTMEIQSTGCKSLFSEQIMFNFQIRKQSKNELDFYNKLINTRRLELKDLLERKAKEILLDNLSFSTESEHYVVNRFRAQPVVKEELQEKIMPLSATRGTGMNITGSPTKPGQKGEEKLAYKYRRPGMARRGKRTAADVDDKFGKEKKEDQVEDETRLTIKQQKKELDYYKKNWRSIDGYELLYEPFELQTNSRKRGQIFFIKEIIRRMKKEFNKEFEELCNYKSEQISMIKEKNSKIEELQRDLKESVDLFGITEDKREQPELILKVQDSDIKIPKFLTKEEREKLEEEKRKDEERIKSLQSDTIGRRGIVKMMNGVLEIKREFDELEKALVRQPWMDLSENQMTESQRQEYTKFRQMEEDLKERKLNQQKAWRQELNKARNDIDEICDKFEERMNKLVKRKHFMQLRIYEQELYIIRLSLSLYEERLLRESRE